MSTAAHGGTLRVTHEVVLEDGLQAYYATELRQSVLSVWHLCACDFDVCHWGIATSSAQVDELELLHRRSCYTLHGILREAVRKQLVTVRLDRKFVSTKARQKFKTLCDICAKAKIISRALFPKSQERDQAADLRPGKCVGADFLIVLKVPSREEYTSVLFLVDFACIYCWVYLQKK